MSCFVVPSRKRNRDTWSTLECNFWGVVKSETKDVSSAQSVAATTLRSSNKYSTIFHYTEKFMGNSRVALIMGVTILSTAFAVGNFSLRQIQSRR